MPIAYSPFPIPHSLLPIPHSPFPIPHSPFPIPPNLNLFPLDNFPKIFQVDKLARD
ncbi:hypothetical protein [Roseofilum capinflatum]|uniref:Uncharacterized protein n=1 Tax=Roseofilum capinflatum BLCC-M114 TaxID=3022440 RepID=A0ABT7B0E4_9CYAN|nr:hypothetical protein [Roseofilum capinflatum]MDJ1172615.1 hypothetical protein [Roseofilum capinflatum BLCC-M114]